MLKRLGYKATIAVGILAWAARYHEHEREAVEAADCSAVCVAQRDQEQFLWFVFAIPFDLDGNSLSVSPGTQVRLPLVVV